ncbi:solute carrier family 35 member F6-like isoform X2 [Dysidea avara]|uniref:solute carrier family 35 member F6-like isoform X2 n=1 Tax=Dysidea avara TaxID=196820 RepID=UPI00331679CF
MAYEEKDTIYSICVSVNDRNWNNHYFDHKTLGMFVGEASCLVVFKILFYYHKWVKKDVNRFGKQKFSPWVFAIPALCDIIGTSTMFVGLNLTNASSFQLLRGSLIIFTALLSVAFFGSKLRLYHWVGMMTVVIGLVVVGLGDVLGEDNSGDAHSVLAGDLLIVTAQIVAAIQMIVEQLFVQGLNVPPLQAIGWEGVFGFCFLGIGLVAMYFIPWHFPSGPIFWEQPTRFEDVIDAVHQIFYIPTLTVAFFLSIVSVAFLNYAGMSVTKEINAITRTTLDNVRTLFIWIFGLAFMWQKFNLFQPIGFLILVIGTFIYYNMIFSWVMKRLHVWPSFCGAPDDED